MYGVRDHKRLTHTIPKTSKRFSVGFSGVGGEGGGSKYTRYNLLDCSTRADILCVRHSVSGVLEARNCAEVYLGIIMFYCFGVTKIRRTESVFNTYYVDDPGD